MDYMPIIRMVGAIALGGMAAFLAYKNSHVWGWFLFVAFLLLVSG